MNLLKHRTKRRIIDGILTKLGNVDAMLHQREPYEEILKEHQKVYALVIELIKRIK